MGKKCYGPSRTLKEELMCLCPARVVVEVKKVRLDPYVPGQTFHWGSNLMSVPSHWHSLSSALYTVDRWIEDRDNYVGGGLTWKTARTPHDEYI